MLFFVHVVEEGTDGGAGCGRGGGAEHEGCHRGGGARGGVFGDGEDECRCCGDACRGGEDVCGDFLYPFHDRVVFSGVLQVEISLFGAVSVHHHAVDGGACLGSLSLGFEVADEPPFPGVDGAGGGDEGFVVVCHRAGESECVYFPADGPVVLADGEVGGVFGAKGFADVVEVSVVRVDDGGMEAAVVARVVAGGDAEQDVYRLLVDAGE